MELKRVVVTGLGAVTPIGNTFPEFWKSLCAGVNGVGEITRFDASKFKTRFAFEVKNFDTLNFFDRKEARKYDLFSQFAIVASEEAIADSGINAQNTNFDDVGVIFSSGIGGITSLSNDEREYFAGDGTPLFSPYLIPKLLPDLAAGHISIKHGFHGPNFATLSACASSLNAIIEAFNYIRYNRASVIIAGGAEAPICEPSIGGFGNMKALSTRNDDYKTASRPFDANRDGFVMGEGGGSLVIEELEHAIRRGAHIYGEIVGAGLSADAYHQTAPHPEGLGAFLSMKRAIEDAKMKPEDIDHINTHGTSTPLGDTIEPMAIKRLFGEHAYKISINATKSMTGHLLGGSGAIETIASLMAIKDGIIPPTINHITDDPSIDPKLDFTFNKAKVRNINTALCNAFGFGGHNATLLFKKYEE